MVYSVRADLQIECVHAGSQLDRFIDDFHLIVFITFLQIKLIKFYSNTNSTLAQGYY
jgi:hypothetical protein